VSRTGFQGARLRSGPNKSLELPAGSVRSCLAVSKPSFHSGTRITPVYGHQHEACTIRFRLVNIVAVIRSCAGGRGAARHSAQTGPKHGFHQCGIKLTGSDIVSPYISTHDLCMLETAFCLYTALLLVELMLTTASRLNSAPVERMLWPCLPSIL
jgi:hypothetical protein